MAIREKYQLWTCGGLTPSLGAGLNLGAQAILVEVQKVSEPNRCAQYAVYGVSGGYAKAGISVATGPSSTSDFESEVTQADLFWGTVRNAESGVCAGLGYGYSDMEWISGPATGTKCSGWGFTSGVSLSATAANVSVNRFVFVGWRAIPAHTTPSSIDTHPKAHTDRQGRTVYE